MTSIVVSVCVQACFWTSARVANETAREYDCATNAIVRACLQRRNTACDESASVYTCAALRLAGTLFVEVE